MLTDEHNELYLLTITALTVDNILKELREVKWDTLSGWSSGTALVSCNSLPLSSVRLRRGMLERLNVREKESSTGYGTVHMRHGECSSHDLM